MRNAEDMGSKTDADQNVFYSKVDFWSRVIDRNSSDLLKFIVLVSLVCKYSRAVGDIFP